MIAMAESLATIWYLRHPHQLFTSLVSEWAAWVQVSRNILKNTA